MFRLLAVSSFFQTLHCSQTLGLCPGCAFHPEHRPSPLYLTDSCPICKLQAPRSLLIMHSHKCIITWAVDVFGQELHMKCGDSNHRPPWSGPSASIDARSVVHISLSVIYFPSLCTPSSHHTHSTWTQFPLLTCMHMYQHTRAHAIGPPLICTTPAPMCLPKPSLTLHMPHTTRQARVTSTGAGSWVV